jgi:hypothetical protein
MHSKPESLLMLHNVRHCALQDEAARLRSVRRAYGSGFPPLGIAATSYRLRVALGRAGERLRDGRLRRSGALLRAEAG